MVIPGEASRSAVVNQGRYRCTGASSSTAWLSTSCITATAVKDLLSEPSTKGVWE